ncbi:hypothetical protein [Bacteroides sp.]|uniref:hypothetical protein n=1 Tax=Bacteroides sp. TaxID=29523 RepID=UPI0026335CD8|nr:hypothetical protein [Bacteroides sp.]MDD3040714.1 hypothetical protein [Bacteroides sp.]
MDYKHRQRCKVCNSPHRKEIDKMIFDGKTKANILRTYPNEGLTYDNLKKHEALFFVDIRNQAVYDYKNSPEAKHYVEETVTELDALDNLRGKLHRYIMDQDLDDIAPRKLEVLGDLLIRSISTKAEILSTINSVQDDPFKIITEILNNNPINDLEGYTPPLIEDTTPMTCKFWKKESEFHYTCICKDTDYAEFSDTAKFCPKSAFCLLWEDTDTLALEESLSNLPIQKPLFNVADE